MSCVDEASGAPALAELPQKGLGSVHALPACLAASAPSACAAAPLLLGRRRGRGSARGDAAPASKKLSAAAAVWREV